MQTLRARRVHGPAPGGQPQSVHPPELRPGGRAFRAGFTLIEVAVAIVVLLVAVSGLSSAVVSALNLAHSNEETAIASDAARQVAESLQDVNFSDIFATFNSDPADDPGGAGVAPGNNFAVTGLAPLSADADGLAGQIIFPTSGLGGAAVALREDAVDLSLGLPRDLNADGNVDAANHANDYVLLPVTVRIDWQGSSGVRFLEFDMLLVN